MEKDSFIIIDANSLVNRAYYAMTGMRTSRGEPVGAVYGFTNMLIKLIEQYRPRYVAAAFDVHAPTFRHKMTPLYKSTRKPMPDELASQMPILKELLAAMGIKQFELAGYEADDIIGTLCKADVFTYVLTGDRDSLQLVSPTTHALLTKRGITDIMDVSPENVSEVFGVSAEQVVDFKALAGDQSDNIPGVKGIGDRTAVELLSKYGSLDEVYAHLDEITPSRREKLESEKDNAYLSRALAEINCDVPISYSLDECRFSFPLPAAAREIFTRLEFKSMLKNAELFAPEDAKGTPSVSSSVDIKRVILTTDEFSSVVNRAGDNVAILFTEDGMHVALDGKTDYFAPITNDLLSPFTVDSCVKTLEPLYGKHVLAFDIKSLLHTVAPAHIPNADDVALMAYLLEYRLMPETAAELFSYFDECKQKLIERGMSKLYTDIELPLAYVLYDMECIGFTIDREALDRIDAHFSALEQQSAKRILEIYGGDFNLNSPKQLARVLFEDLKIPYPGKPPYSTKAEILQKLTGEYEIVDEVLKYRFNSKLKSTFIEGVRKAIQRGGTVHTSFNQMITATGRLSSADPNLQNIPTRTDEGKLLRSMFIPKAGNVLVDADYKQIELKLLAHYSGDPKLVDAFNTGEDIHTSTAAEVFGVDKSEVTHEMRRDAKAVNFGIIYGISNYGLSQNISIPQKKADEYINRYFERFPAVKAYLDELIASAKEKGYATTELGRRRAIPELNSAKFMERKFGERVAMNMPLQGAAADIIKIAMINVHKALEGKKSKLIMQVHDELIVDTSPDEVDDVLEILKREMENAVDLKVPLDVDISVGKNWMECK